MASRKRTPETSRITRGPTVAFARKQKGSGDAGDAGDDDPKPADDAKPAAADAASAPASGEAKAESPGGSGAPLAGDGAKSAHGNELPTPVDIPHAAAAAPAAAPPPEADAPTHMPAPRDVPTGDPDAPAPPPGRVPPGDSRSLRRGSEFALVYRATTFVITRVGVVGTRGQWRVVEYPTSAAASHAYAKECSRFVADGFSDYRA